MGDMMSDISALEHYLHEHIPLSRAMQVAIRQADPERVVLSAPLAPNINHRETVFGGSASALAILSAWTLLYVRLRDANVNARVVIQRNSMQYLQAIPDAFEAVTSIADDQAWQRFLHMLNRKRRARIHLTATLFCAGRKVGEMEGDFVAVQS
jgi:thioesterase domain-containing protein